MKIIKINSITNLSMVVTSMIGLFAFIWPFLIQENSILNKNSDYAGILLLVIVPLVFMVALADIMQGGIDSRALAILGVLIAVVAAIRPMGGGIAGLEPVWAIIIIGGRSLGASFGFVLGAMGLLGSAILTGGIGPWLPFQMMVAAWVGAGAGLLPKLIGKKEIFLLAVYGFIVAFIAGLFLNLWFWPFANGLLPQISFEPGLAINEQLSRWVRFTLLTSAGFDLPRAITTALLLFFLSSPLLKAMRRMTKKANFSKPVDLLV